MRRWLIAGLLAIAGLVLTLVLFPHREASIYWRFQLGPEEAVARARELARFHGVDAQRWRGTARSVASSFRLQYTRLFDRPPHPLISTAEADVILTAPDGNRAVLATFSSEGRPISFEVRHRPGDRLRPGGPPARVATAALQLYAGDFARSFEIDNEGVPQGNDVVYSWNWKAPSPEHVAVRFETVFEEGALKSAKLLPSFPAPYTERIERERTRGAWLVTAAILAIGGVFFLAFPAFFRGFVRRLIPLPRLVAVAALSLGATLLSFVAGRAWPEIVFATGEDLTGVSTRLTQAFIGNGLLAATAVLFYGAGRSLVSRHDLLRWRGFELLLDRRWWTRPVGEGFAGGVLSGCALSAIPLLASLPAPRAVVNANDQRLFYSALPAAVPMLGVYFQDLTAAFLFLWPFCTAGRWPWLKWPLFAGLGAAGLAFLRAYFDLAPFPSVATSLLLLGGFSLIYRTFGLLGVFASGMTLPAIHFAAALGLQPAAALRANIPFALAWPAVMLVGGAIIARYGKVVDSGREIEEEQAALVEAGSDRDRLRAEFNVARRAQVGMLPELPPSVEGLGLAGSCHPAREVGGDLYDFVSCADGRYGFCVADVSGKGVPASLYMAMTKGLIAAAMHDSSDPGQILGWLNRHWVEHGKRKMFATMAMCFYDPRSRTLEYVRAGHNPIVVWQNGEGRLAAPAGVGLGLASPKMFDRTLRRETIQLQTGDLVVLYSDGIVEAMNLDREQFGEERLLEAVRDCQEYSALEAEQEISRRVRLFIGAAPPHDDMTLLVLKAV